jgi:hypothetical protein
MFRDLQAGRIQFDANESPVMLERNEARSPGADEGVEDQVTGPRAELYAWLYQRRWKCGEVASG